MGATTAPGMRMNEIKQQKKKTKARHIQMDHAFYFPI